ncbi:hypothetical protein SELMODRAFT_431160 [Selaginella moellendorffii]|uniref:Uncharacterized protein n=1 Tax=Selaginella moellendorffii TaxID=88036 RepID=D8TBQ4_SELML|nr:hypothetical protein SELMODRAFT_431160 [Selaginella moellendorffii]
MECYFVSTSNLYQELEILVDLEQAEDEKVPGIIKQSHEDLDFFFVHITNSFLPCGPPCCKSEQVLTGGFTEVSIYAQFHMSYDHPVRDPEQGKPLRMPKPSTEMAKSITKLTESGLGTRFSTRSDTARARQVFASMPDWERSLWTWLLRQLAKRKPVLDRGVEHNYLPVRIPQQAKELFDAADERDGVSWTAVIAALSPPGGDVLAGLGFERSNVRQTLLRGIRELFLQEDIVHMVLIGSHELLWNFNLPSVMGATFWEGGNRNYYKFIWDTPSSNNLYVVWKSHTEIHRLSHAHHPPTPKMTATHVSPSQHCVPFGR